MKQWLYGLTIFLFLCNSLFGEDLSFRAYVSANAVSLDGQFQYSVEVSGSTTNLPPVDYPEFADFYVLSGPNASTNVQWINGNLTSKKTFSFVLKPRRKGQIDIAPAVINIKNKQYKTDPITITVTDAANKPAQRKQASPPKTTDADISGENLYLKAVVSDRNIVLGEQVLIEYKLYFKVNVRGYDFEKLPSNAGFWAEEIELPAQPAIENEIVNGVNYNVAVLKKYALFPTQTGKLTIEPMHVKLEALVRSNRRRSIFDSFFDDPFGNTVQKKVSSKPVTLTVNALPAAGKPADFNGAVGRYNLSVETDKQEAGVNEAISLNIRINGSGNIKILELPEPLIPPDIERYEPKISSNVNTKGNVIRGSKQSEHILIPRLPGTYTIKPLHFSYFDPVARQYKTLKSEPATLKITGETAKVSGPQIQYSRQEVELLGEDIRFIKEQTDFEKIGYRPYLSGIFWLVMISGLVLFSAFLVYNDYSARISGDVRLSRSKRASRLASKTLKHAKTAMTKDNSAEFYRAISLAVRGFVQDKLNLELSDFSAGRARQLLGAKGIDTGVIDNYVELLDESDMRQYANIPSSAEDLNKLYERAKKLLIQLEKYL